MNEQSFPLSVGDSARFSKTVGETDVYMFAGISGDFARNHVDETFMAANGRGGRIAHGALLVGYMSTASTKVCEKLPEDAPLVPVSLGYDRIRFLKPVAIGDTVTVDYRIAEIDLKKMRSRSDIEVTNQNGDLVAVARHILMLVAREKLFG
jgi:acyl dehydratase